jgi:uncharacterized protein YgbK (DUF1537 family)
LADDLTGAAEAAAACRKMGLRAIVLPKPGKLPAGTAALAVNTNTRHSSGGNASKTVRDVVAALGAARCTTLFKKTDSTLRGNIPQELGALMDVRPGRPLVYAPAFPAAGRTVREGVLLVHGEPVESTDFADDPLCPVRESCIAELLAQVKRPVCLTAPDDLARLLGSPGAHASLFVVDGESELDLSVAAAAAAEYDCLCAGPASFVSHMARHLDLPLQAPPEAPVAGPWLVLAGSLHPVSLAQVRTALANGAEALAVPPGAAFRSEPDHAWLELAGRAMNSAWKSGRPAVVHTALERKAATGYSARAAALGLDRATAARRLTDHLAECAARLLEAQNGNALVFGGETLQAFVLRMGFERLESLSELTPGAALMLAGGTRRRMLVASKSGGFGTEKFIEEFVRCCWE